MMPGDYFHDARAGPQAVRWGSQADPNEPQSREG